jgi:hypothetical protein
MKSPDETPQIQFLQSIDLGGKGHDGTPFHDVHISDYNHDKLRKLKNVSDKRWVKGINLKLWPGKGSGKVEIASETFDVTYAWGGRNKPDYTTTGARTSYTVRLEGENVSARLAAIRDAIIQDEVGSLTYQVSYRKHQRANGTKSKKDGEKKVIQNLKDMRRLKGTEQLIERQENTTTEHLWLTNFRKQWEENKPLTFQHQMKNIETDMIK